MDRRLVTILAADAVGFSRLMAEDEEATSRTLEAYHATIAELIDEHGGRIFGSAGDSVVAEFPSPVQSVRTAVAIQRALSRRNADLAPGRRMEFRIGVNLGDVMTKGEDLLGDAVNIASRLQELAAPGEICISRSVREHIGGKLSFPLARIGERTLKNIPRPIEVHKVDWRLENPTPIAELDSGGLALPDKPSIAVLPFVNMSGDPEQEYFADGLSEDIITGLSQFRWFFVIARNSTFAYKVRAVDVKQAARELGVRYVVEGSVRKAGARVRVTAQLIDAETGAHLWAERYDREFADIFAIQDEITDRVVGAIEPEIVLGEGRRAVRKSGENLDAFDCCMRGMWHLCQWSAEENLQAERWLRRAIDRDPTFARAHMALARTLTARCVWGWSSDIQREWPAARVAAERALALDDRDPSAHYILSVCTLLSRRHQQALAEAQRAIDLCPNHALGFAALGWTRIFIGNFTEALDPLLRCLRLSPHDPLNFLFFYLMALAFYHLGRYDEAAGHAERAVRGRRTHVALRTLLASLGQLGRAEEAATVRAEMEETTPADAERYWELTNPYADPSHLAHLVEGLRKAGADG